MYVDYTHWAFVPSFEDGGSMGASDIVLRKKRKHKKVELSQRSDVPKWKSIEFVLGEEGGEDSEE